MTPKTNHWCHLITIHDRLTALTYEVHAMLKLLLEEERQKLEEQQQTTGGHDA